MAEISKGVWVPRGLSRRPAGGVMNPEDEEDDRAPVLAPAPTGDDGYYSVARRGCPLPRAMAEADLPEKVVRPLEPVAAVTYAEARAHAEKAAKAAAALEKVFKNSPCDLDNYKEAEWNEVPETETTAPISATWYSCVKRYRFIQYGNGPLAGGSKLIIEVVLMGDTSLRYILKLSQVKSVITKSNVRETNGYLRIEEVIIDLRHQHYGYAPEQVKLKFAGTVSALAFQMDLMSAL